MRQFYFLSCVVFVVEGVFGADGVKAISAKVGEDVILHTDDAEVQRADELLWRIQGEKSFIAQFDREINKVLINTNDKRFIGRLLLDKTTGSLTIKNINTTDSGVYELQISSQSRDKTKIFSLTVHHGLKSVSVMEGETIPGVTQIFTDRLNSTAASRSNINLNKETGEIRNIKGDQSGDLEAKINNNNSGSSAAVSGICGVNFGLLVWAATVLLLLEVQVTKHVSEKGLG
ncbi:uncharacterized protein LOC125272963 [Megalobrama amblycephala]|uniref:uncharacterized protein LOC125272963 n=1 Tax=Megalobrama amblycephala TaxID=75352 RepID=UPI002013E7C9|nr:uncharacterized protein LOC125272963 [Megalobrama amblycephala]